MTDQGQLPTHGSTHVDQLHRRWGEKTLALEALKTMTRRSRRQSWFLAEKVGRPWPRHGRFESDGPGNGFWHYGSRSPQNSDGMSAASRSGCPAGRTVQNIGYTMLCLREADAWATRT